MDSMLRLAWAFPLVLIAGLLTVLLLKRLAMTGARPAERVPRLLLRESLVLSDETRLHCVELDGMPYLLVESVRHASFHRATPSGAEGSVPRRATSAWLSRIRRVPPS